MTRTGKLYYDYEEGRGDWMVFDRAVFDMEAPHSKDCLKILCRMIQEQFNLPLTNVWRVHVLNDGLVELNDFTLPSNTGKLKESFLQENLPQWVQDSLSVLMIVDQGTTVEGVGKKISDSIFYLLETPEIGEIYGRQT
jgi:hypothetical protein